MSYPWKLFALLLVASYLVSSVVASARRLGPESAATLLSRLKLAEQRGSDSCWGALSELQSCSGELVLFFLNGETQLGPNCCSAIRTIQHQCWPTMLGSLGITTEESDILRGYCDAAAQGGSAGAPPPPLMHHCFSKFPRVLP